MKIRKGKSTDQENTHKAFQLLMRLIKTHQKEIEPALWVGAMIGALAENFEESGVAFDVFNKEMMRAVQHYKY